MVTKSDQAYKALRRVIVVGEIAANTPLDETHLMERLGTGRTPIREALKRLALEQFVVWPPRRTAYVREIGPFEVSRLYESRLVLEEPVARLSAERITDARIAELDRICSELELASDAGNAYEAVELEQQLHMAIAHGSDNRFLVEAVGNLNRGSLRLWYIAQQQLGLENHRDIVEALRTRDPERAAAEARRHVLASYDRQVRLQALATTGPLGAGGRAP